MPAAANARLSQLNEDLVKNTVQKRAADVPKLNWTTLNPYCRTPLLASLHRSLTLFCTLLFAAFWYILQLYSWGCIGCFFFFSLRQASVDILISQGPMGLSLRTVIGSKGFGGLLFIFKTRSRWLFCCRGTLCWSNMNHETSSCFVCFTGTIISAIYHISPIYHLYITYKWLFQWWIFLCRLPEADMLFKYPRTSTILQRIAHRCGKMMAFWSGWECTLTLSGLQWLWFSSMQSGALAVFHGENWQIFHGERIVGFCEGLCF